LHLPVRHGVVPVTGQLTDVPLDLVQEDADLLQVRLGLLPLLLRPLDVLVVAGDAGDVVQYASPLQVGHAHDAIDVPLLDEVVPVGGDAGVGQQVVELVEGAGLAVDVEVGVVGVLLRGAVLDHAGEGDLVRVDGEDPVRVVEDQGDPAALRGPLGLAAVEDKVGQLARPDGLG
jgi:hypothetical protein